MQNLQLEKINETSSMTTFIARHSQKLDTILQELHLRSRYFAVLVNGQKVSPEHQIDEGDEILILPKIAGG